MTGQPPPETPRREGSAADKPDAPPRTDLKPLVHLRLLPVPLVSGDLFRPPIPPPGAFAAAESVRATPPVRGMQAQTETVSFPVAKPPPVPVRIPHPQADPQPATATPGAEPEEAIAEATALRPIYGFVLFVALALGTFPVASEVRFTLLWLLMLGAGAAYALFDQDVAIEPVDMRNLSWGAGFGFVFSLPFVLIASRSLAQASRAFIPIQNVPALLQTLLVIWPLGETLYYRGLIQRESGLLGGAILAGISSIVLYWPETGGVLAVLFVAVAFSTALAFVYGYVRLRYGLAAAFAAQVTANLMLLLLPRLLVAPV